MKMLLSVLAVLALATLTPAYAAENAPLPTPAFAAPTASPACDGGAASELPAWLSAEPLSEPILWTEGKALPFVLSVSCGQYCRTCDGCCAILGPNSCACC